MSYLLLTDAAAIVSVKFTMDRVSQKRRLPKLSNRVPSYIRLKCKISNHWKN